MSAALLEWPHVILTVLHELGAFTVFIVQTLELCRRLRSCQCLSVSQWQVWGWTLGSWHSFYRFLQGLKRASMCRMAGLSTFRNPWSLPGRLEDFRNNPKVLFEENLPGSVSGWFFKISFLLPCTLSVCLLPSYLHPPPKVHMTSVPVRIISDWARYQAQCSEEGKKYSRLPEPPSSVCLCFFFDRKLMIA